MRAALFDLDGTLVDNMALHTDAWVEVSAMHGPPVGRDRFLREWAGKKNEELIPLMLGRDASADELARIALEKETRYRARAAVSLEPVPGVLALLARLKASGVRLVVATAAPLENRVLVLEGRLQLGRFFEAVIGPESAARGKPSPDIFLAAAREVGAKPAECVVFEDALNGVRAGVAAGMRVAAVTTTTDEPSLRAAGAEWVVPDFVSLPPELERALA